MDIITQAARDRQRVLEYFQNHKDEKGVTVTYVCHRYHTSRKTFYEWQGRWDGTVESLADRSRAPHKTRQGHTAEQLKMIKRLAKKHHWNDILLAYQEAVQRYGYPFCYQTFKKKVREMYAEKGMKKRRKERTNLISEQNILGKKCR